MEPVERLMATEEIKQLKARYFRCMDTKDWAGLTAVFAPDAVLDMSGEVGKNAEPGAGVTRGQAAIGAFMKAAVEDIVTVHHGHMAEITITSPTTATGVWSMEDKLRFPDGTEMHGYGHYHETYEKIDGRWRIKSTTLSRLRVDTEMA
jgi:uncharacterized protein (TIGR02246 family)